MLLSRKLLAVVAVAGLLAGCGGDDGSSEPNAADSASRRSEFKYTEPTSSMMPTIEKGDEVSGTTEVEELERGDIVVFEAPPGAASSTGGPLMLKRLIGLPGDVLEGRDGVIYVNGNQLDEPYLRLEVRSHEFEQEKVPVGRYWVLGDNRQDFRDSTYFKSIPKESIKAVITHIDAPKEREGDIG